MNISDYNLAKSCVVLWTWFTFVYSMARHLFECNMYIFLYKKYKWCPVEVELVYTVSKIWLHFYFERIIDVFYFYVLVEGGIK